MFFAAQCTSAIFVLFIHAHRLDKLISACKIILMQRNTEGIG